MRMSLSRQVLSSPFDAPQRPRAVASRQNGDRKKVNTLRRSTFNAATSNIDITTDSGRNDKQPPGCVVFDSRLIKGDVFANPIVTVKYQQQQDSNDDVKKVHQNKQRTISTPPPVKGRMHISIQTDDNAGGNTSINDTRDDVMSACINSLEDLSIDVVDKEANEAEVTEDVVDVPKLIIAGAPASGKGTQCELIKEKYGVVHLSTGDMLRAAVAADTDVGKRAKDFMDAGKLVPDEVIIGVVKDRLDESDCVESGWLLDGFPRTPAQAVALADAGVTADCFIFLNVPDEVLVERVVGRRTDPESGKIYHMTFSPPGDEEILARLEQRSDDTEEKVKVRLEQFHANVDAVKGSYTDIAVEVDGALQPDVVSETIMKYIDSVLS